MKHNMFIQNIKIFPGYLPQYLFEQCMLCSKCCGIFDSYVWSAYFPKAFGIFQWVFPTIFVGNNVWEIPPKKGYGNLFQNMFKELFVVIFYLFPRHIIQHSTVWLSLLKLFPKSVLDLFLKKSVWQISL